MDLPTALLAANRRGAQGARGGGGALEIGAKAQRAPGDPAEGRAAIPRLAPLSSALSGSRRPSSARIGQDRPGSAAFHVHQAGRPPSRSAECNGHCRCEDAAALREQLRRGSPPAALPPGGDGPPARDFQLCQTGSLDADRRDDEESSSDRDVSSTELGVCPPSSHVLPLLLLGALYWGRETFDAESSSKGGTANEGVRGARGSVFGRTPRSWYALVGILLRSVKGQKNDREDTRGLRGPTYVHLLTRRFRGSRDVGKGYALTSRESSSRNESSNPKYYFRRDFRARSAFRSRLRPSPPVPAFPPFRRGRIPQNFDPDTASSPQPSNSRSLPHISTRPSNCSSRTFANYSVTRFKESYVREEESSANLLVTPSTTIQAKESYLFGGRKSNSERRGGYRDDPVPIGSNRYEGRRPSSRPCVGPVGVNALRSLLRSPLRLRPG
ncbi:hypothetical protein KM043_008903 [Ampulex compressa]|nr:hypothetical protein KM043_008903 [Ampulex compressa]